MVALVRSMALAATAVAGMLVSDLGLAAYQAILVAGIALCMTMLPNCYYRHQGGETVAMWIDYGKWFFSILLLGSVAMHSPTVLQAELVMFALCGITGWGRPYRVALAAIVATVALAGLWLAADPDLPWTVLLLLVSGLYLLMEPMWARRSPASPPAPQA